MDDLMSGHIGAFMLGQLTISLSADQAVLAGPGPCPGELEIAANPDAIRAWVRFDALGRYRPLSGARTMRPNWHAKFTTLEALNAALDAVYPLAQTHMALWEDGTIRVVSLPEVLGRQSGRYASAGALSASGQDVAAALLCGGCVRAPLWRREYPAEGEIPCPEPCSVLVSYCREAAGWEAEGVSSSNADPLVQFAAFDVPGNALREGYLSVLESRRDQ